MIKETMFYPIETFFKPGWYKHWQKKFDKLQFKYFLASEEQQPGQNRMNN